MSRIISEQEFINVFSLFRHYLKFFGSAIFSYFRLDDLLKQPFKVEKSMILKINNKQKSWVAGYYPELEKMTFKQVLLRSGYGNGPISR